MKEEVKVMTALCKGFFQSRMYRFLKSVLKANIYIGKSLSQVPENALIFFPYRPNVLYCGIVGMIAVKRSEAPQEEFSVKSTVLMADEVEQYSYQYSGHIIEPRHYSRPHKGGNWQWLIILYS